MEASKPNKPKLLMVGVLFALLFGVAAPVIYELLFDRRLHCRDDFERNFAIPVLAQFGPILASPRTVLK